MKLIVGIIFATLIVSSASAQYQPRNTFGSSGLSGMGSNPDNHYVAPHLNSNGSYVGGHQQTNPNNTQLDNYGTRGNVNPYTGSVGTRGARY